MTFLSLFEEYLKRNEEGRVDLGSQLESTWQGKHGRCGPCLWQGWHVAWGVSHRAKEAEGLAGEGAELWASKSILLQPASSSWAPPLNGSTTSQQHQWTTSCSNPRACGQLLHSNLNSGHYSDFYDHHFLDLSLKFQHWGLHSLYQPWFCLLWQNSWYIAT